MQKVTTGARDKKMEKHHAIAYGFELKQYIQKIKIN